MLAFGPIAAPASAKVKINLGINLDVSGGRQISCEEGRWRLEDRGFRRVRALDCRGKRYIYTGWRGGRFFEIVIRSRNGRIVAFYRID